MSDNTNNKKQENTNNETENQSNTSKGEAQQIYTLIGRLVYKFLNSPKIIGLLTTKPIIGNFAIASLVTVTGVSIFDNINLQKIDARSMCDKTKFEVASQLDIDSSEMEVIVADPISANIRNRLFSCNYNIQDKSGKGSDNKTYHIKYQILRDELITDIQEEKITIDSLNEVCQDPDIYKKELLNSNKIDYSPEEHIVQEINLVLQPAGKLKPVYPVFRWQCNYTLISKNEKSKKRPGEKDSITIPIGLDLDIYCEKKYGDNNLTKATHHNPNDPYSLYCVDPNLY